MRQVEITVVIPLYNKESTILRALNSVLCQLDKDDKVIVVDDGSTDSSAEIVKALNHCQVIFMSQANQGVSSARNKGVEFSDTNFVAFLDADDWWVPGALDRLKSMIHHNPYCTIYCNGHVRNANNVNIGQEYSDLQSDWDILEGVDFIDEYSRNSLINSSTACVRKSSLQFVGGFPHGVILGEDIYTWLRLALCGKVSVCREALAVIDREPPNKDKFRDAMPYYITWFGNLENYRKLSNIEKKAIVRFVVRRGFYSCAGEVMAGRRFGAFKQVLAISKLARWFILLGGLLVLLPRSVLASAYNIKNKVN